MDETLRSRCVAFVLELLNQDYSTTHEELVERVVDEFDVDPDDAAEVVEDCTSEMDDLDLEE